MPRSVISYDKDLPEIPGRLPWCRPDAHLIKDQDAETRWRVRAGRRDSQLLLVPKIRSAVDDWRDQGYPDASEVTRRLFEYWFDEDHEVAGFNTPFRYYFCQREAMETLAWLVEIAAKRDAVRGSGTLFYNSITVERNKAWVRCRRRRLLTLLIRPGRNKD